MQSKYHKSGIYKSELYRLIKDRFPDFLNNNDQIKVRELAPHMGASYEILYQAFRRGNLLYRHAVTLSKFSEDIDRVGLPTVSVADFHERGLIRE